jgi:hypothetical protein
MVEAREHKYSTETTEHDHQLERVGSGTKGLRKPSDRRALHLDWLEMVWGPLLGTRSR